MKSIAFYLHRVEYLRGETLPNPSITLDRVLAIKVVLRLHRQDKRHVLEVIEHLIPLLSSVPLEHLLWIVEETRVRIRS